MKTILSISTATALLTLICMLGWRWIGPAVLMDVLLPPDVIVQTSVEQRIEIHKRIIRVTQPSSLHWIAISTICIGNCVCLYSLSREKRNHSTHRAHDLKIPER